MTRKLLISQTLGSQFTIVSPFVIGNGAHAFFEVESKFGTLLCLNISIQPVYDALNVFPQSFVARILST